jgi:transposase
VRAVTAFDGVFLHRDTVDMRRSLDGLSEIVRHGMEKPLDGRLLFVFIGKSKDRIKLLYWDRTGYALWYKRLERGRFHWPKSGDTAIALSPEILGFLLDGVDVFVKPHESVEFDRRW